jgi:hypothetical protein
MTRATSGPWLLVAGMHRSGTSAVTGALVALGFQPFETEDRIDWPESNPEHWESLSLSLFDEKFLIRLDGAWDAPPELAEGWEGDPDLPSLAEAAAALQAAYPDSGPAVWKDPRLCLLLPYWRHVLPDPLAAVLVWRSPTAVADSLLRRDEMPLVDGLALWERYNRSAIEGLEGVDTYVIEYESMIEDPRGALAPLVSWLESLEQFGELGVPFDVDRAVQSIAREGDRSNQEGADLVQEEQSALVDYLVSLRGAQRPLPSMLPTPESPWTTSLLRMRRILSAPNRDLKEAREQLEWARADIANLRSSTSWRMTAPLRSVVSSYEDVRRRWRPSR